MQPEDQQDVQECLGARVGQAQPGDAGPVVVQMTGSQVDARASAPVMGSWLSRWTASSRRLAV
jgi:hypothetical protein